jgi:multidrug efflux pump subunit AcrA (membrane-fusion protein)
MWLPPQAIRRFEGRRFVVVQDAEGQRRVDVKVGITSDDRVEILEGLEEGQVVIAP